MRVLFFVLAFGACVQAARLRAKKAESFPFEELLQTFKAKGDEHGSWQDPQWLHINKRLVMFKDAVHHMVLAKKAHKLSKTNATVSKAVSKKKGDPVGHVFEHVSDDKTCEPAGLMGSEKGVTSPDGCKELCAGMAGCVAFAFSIKPFKQCEFFSECTETDANKIRKYSVYAIMKDGDIEDRETCGELPKYPASKPTDAGTNLAEPRAFVAEDEVTYECDRDTTIDGSKDGPTEFKAVCGENGYFKPERHGCVEKSECGAIPCLRKAHPTGKTKGSKKNPIVEMVCDAGYSLDGEKVIPGGNMNNAKLYLECLDIGKWEAPVDYLGKKGKACEPFAFVPASSMIKMYNKVFEVLFIASCNTELTKWAEMEEKMPPKLEDGTVCGENVADDKEGDCKSLVDDLKTLFEDAKGADNEGFDAKGFCGDMWDLLKMDEPSAQTEC
eukprot:gnl/MRDRNA2_/MRDRNA2_91146_c0_seq1.p1 gnl/MRDRNA2_/MRDRNA2_91146_c0~~gnl/MRDRNA2_/MRDRNA2_91146_c0_seq1.p1  ORF type:complete len:441 (-),score=140.10 gnl/MRDRNA2_/MRDRNA2_91146_c0_seq1:32-1354(-)